MDAKRTDPEVNEEQLGHKLIGAALKVHSAVGPGLLENRVWLRADKSRFHCDMGISPSRTAIGSIS